jgi:uncharacterized protein YbaR (Trm112 family)
LATLSCPHCHQKIDSQAIACPYCRTQLKAYGHPGIPLHRAKKDEYLCDRCTYHADDTCTFPKRPYAKDCTLYQNIEESKLDLQQLQQSKSFGTTLRTWIKRNQTLLLILALLLVCFAIALSTS